MKNNKEYQDKELEAVIPNIIELVIKKGYIIPNKDVYRDRIMKVSNIDIYSSKYEDNDFGKYFTNAITLTSERLIIPLDLEIPSDKNEYDIFIKHLINYNKMVLYDDVFGVMDLENDDQNCNLYTYIAGTGYTGNDKFLEMIFNQILSSKNKNTALENLLVGLTQNSTIIPHGPFRYDMLKKVEQLKPDLLAYILTDNFEKYKLEPNEKNKALAYIFNSQINQEYNSKGEYISAYGVYGQAQSYFNEHPEYLTMLKKNNYFGFQKLKEYGDIIYEPNPESFTDENGSFIQDPDGYTNLREEKNSSSEVLQKIKSGEHIEVLDNSGDWWQVKTKEGKTGYVHKSRVKSGNSNNHSTSFLLYDRPDFSSFSKEVLAKGEIEIVHQNLGWNFVKVNDMTGYLPTKEKKEELQKEEKKKFSFLADEEHIKPEKKKGFWDNLFSS
ncbi:SH3 domain-containing protein [Chryseobacterium ginsenosidimutans]|uniref:SH3 domain-containing protein n=1 Tax=Chryseobacterium ginsenosidimutans TaxID=687846 RepID=UPI0031D9756F